VKSSRVDYTYQPDLECGTASLDRGSTTSGAVIAGEVTEVDSTA
jgi:hypothetical protein